MAMPYFVALIISLIPSILMVVGALALGLWVLIKFGSRLPAPLQSRIRKKGLRTFVGMGSGVQMLVQDSDGILTLTDAKYDSDNGGYWTRLGGKRLFFSALGEGGGPKWFYGANVVLAYDGLGATADLVSAELGKQAEVKMRLAKDGNQLANGFKNILGQHWPKLNAGEAVADGGLPAGVTEWTAYLPKRAIVDLRDTLHLAPFNVKPDQFNRVEENAKAGQSVGFSENMVRIGMLVLGFMLFLIAKVVLSNGGGAAAGVHLPF